MKAHLPATISENSQITKTTVVAGIITGQLAGLIMAVVVMLVFTIFLGTSPLYPVQVIGSLLFGKEALEGFHFFALLVGLILHQLGPSLLWGFLYGILASKFEVTDRKGSVILGLGLGVVSMVGPYLLIPFLMNVLQGVDYWNQEVPILWDWAAHIVFGLSFSFYVTIKNKLGNRV